MGIDEPIQFLNSDLLRESFLKQKQHNKEKGNIRIWILNEAL